MHRRQGSRQTVAAWRAGNNLSKSAYYYWLKKLRETPAQNEKENEIILVELYRLMKNKLAKAPMPNAIRGISPELIETIRQLENRISVLEETVKAKDAEIERVNQIMLNFKRDIFGQRSEKRKYVTPGIEQPMLFNEAELRQEESAPEPTVEAVTTAVKSYKRKKKE